MVDEIRGMTGADEAYRRVQDKAHACALGFPLESEPIAVGETFL